MALTPSIAADVETIGRIAAVPTILQVVARTTGMRFTAIARVTDDSWTACAVHDLLDFGLKPHDTLALDATICNEVRQHHQPVIFGHASADAGWSSHPLPKHYGFESYTSIPIFRSDGTFFGTLCALDPEPRNLDDPNLLKTLELFAQLIAAHFESEERLAQSGSELLAARDVARLREQFIAVLGHDLRNPLQAIMMSAEMLRLGELNDSAKRTVARIDHSCARMADLISDVLDFARGRLGGGIPIALRKDADLSNELQGVVNELRSAHPDREVTLELHIDHAVTCDGRRIAQLLGNLISNAIQHGATDQPIRVKARSTTRHFELTVCNAGEPIPEAKRAQLFQPFTRSNFDEPSPGLGLGLYIASEIAKAHRGTLELQRSDDAATCFRLKMSAGQAARTG